MCEPEDYLEEEFSRCDECGARTPLGEFLCDICYEQIEDEAEELEYMERELFHAPKGNAPY